MVRRLSSEDPASPRAASSSMKGAFGGDATSVGGEGGPRGLRAVHAHCVCVCVING